MYTYIYYLAKIGQEFFNEFRPDLDCVDGLLLGVEVDEGPL